MKEGCPDERIEQAAVHAVHQTEVLAGGELQAETVRRTLDRSRFVPLIPALLGEFGDIHITATKHERPSRHREALPRPPIKPRQGDEAPTKRPATRHTPSIKKRAVKR